MNAFIALSARGHPGPLHGEPVLCDDRADGPPLVDIENVPYPLDPALINLPRLENVDGRISYHEPRSHRASTGHLTPQRLKNQIYAASWGTPKATDS